MRQVKTNFVVVQNFQVIFKQLCKLKRTDFDHYDFNSDTFFTGVTRSYQRTRLPITYVQQRNRSDQSISFLANIWANFTDSLLRHEGNLNHATKSSTNGCGEKQNLLYELTEEPSYVYRGWFAF